MINEVDVDGSGSIDFAEFLHMMSKKVEETSVVQDQMRRAFKVLATSGKGNPLSALVGLFNSFKERVATAVCSCMS